MNKRIKIFSFIIILLLTINFSACKEKSENEDNNKAQNELFSIRDGRRLFINYCSPCHGEAGDGFGQYFAYGLEPKPSDFTSPDFLKDRSDDLLFKAISEGSISLDKSNLCPPWGNTLQMEELNFIVGYVKYINELANDVNNNPE